MPTIQILILAALLYMFIGMLVGVKFVLKHKLYEDPRVTTAYVKDTILHWPVHLFMVLAAKIIRWNIKDEGDSKREE